MSIYGLIGVVIGVLILAYAFGVMEPIREMLSMVLDIPELEAALGTDPIFKLAIRFAFLIGIFQIIRMIITRRD